MTTDTNERPESAAEYLRRQDEFWRYVAVRVNPERVAAGRDPMSEAVARDCFRILDDFDESCRKKAKP